METGGYESVNSVFKALEIAKDYTSGRGYFYNEETIKAAFDELVSNYYDGENLHQEQLDDIIKVVDVLQQYVKKTCKGIKLKQKILTELDTIKNLCGEEWEYYFIKWKLNLD